MSYCGWISFDLAWSRAFINSSKFISLAWNAASVSLPQNSSCRSQSRYVLTTSLSQ